MTGKKWNEFDSWWIREEMIVYVSEQMSYEMSKLTSE